MAYLDHTSDTNVGNQQNRTMSTDFSLLMSFGFHERLLRIRKMQKLVHYGMGFKSVVHDLHLEVVL